MGLAIPQIDDCVKTMKRLESQMVIIMLCHELDDNLHDYQIHLI